MAGVVPSSAFDGPVQRRQTSAVLRVEDRMPLCGCRVVVRARLDVRDEPLDDDGAIWIPGLDRDYECGRSCLVCDPEVDGRYAE
jgi:hypothetical protein